MSDLVGNPEDRFSQNEAHIMNHVIKRLRCTGKLPPVGLPRNSLGRVTNLLNTISVLTGFLNSNKTVNQIPRNKIKFINVI